MKIVIDSREKLPLEFIPGGCISEVIVDALPFGDYTCTYENGAEMPLYYERKNLADLFGTLTSGMERFRKEINRALENHIQLVIVIEGSLTEVLNGTSYSTVSGDTIIKTLNTLWVKYGVEHKFCNNRSEMKRLILEGFSAIGRNYEPPRPSAAK